MVFLATTPLFFGSGAKPYSAKQAPPKIMLWSWFAEDDFRPLANRDIGVAYLALSLQFEGQRDVIPSPRSIPVWIPSNAYKMAAVRFNFDSYSNERPSFSNVQRTIAVRMIAEIVGLARPQALQIDFDAPRSAWPFYRQLVRDVRERTGPDVFLSVTALVSWCDTAQSWMTGLPVDEIVPMAFYMGQDTPAIVTMLQRGGQFAFHACRASIGVQVPFNDNPGWDIVRPRRTQRTYFFPDQQKWSPQLVARAQKEFLP
jgi:hypothetical protein